MESQRAAAQGEEAAAEEDRDHDELGPLGQGGDGVWPCKRDDDLPVACADALLVRHIGRRAGCERRAASPAPAARSARGFGATTAATEEASSSTATTRSGSCTSTSYPEYTSCVSGSSGTVDASGPTSRLRTTTAASRGSARVGASRSRCTSSRAARTA